MQRGIALALAIFLGIGASVVVGMLGYHSVFLKAAAFAAMFVAVFGGYSWSRKSTSPPPAA